MDVVIQKDSETNMFFYLNTKKGKNAVGMSDQKQGI